MSKLPSSFLILTIVIWHSSQFPYHNHSIISKTFIDLSQGDNEWPKWLFIRENESEVAQLCPSLQPHGLYPAELLRPWESPGKNNGVGCHFLLQGIFLTQGLNPCPLHLWQWQDSFPLVPHGKRQSGGQVIFLGVSLGRGVDVWVGVGHSDQHWEQDVLHTLSEGLLLGTSNSRCFGLQVIESLTIGRYKYKA